MEPTDLPINIATWLLALAPIVVLLVLLAVRQWSASQAGPVGMFAAAAVGYFVLRTPLETLAVASAKGIWDAIFILYVVWAALFLYIVTERAGGYDALRRAFTRFSQNELFIVVALGWVFSSFLQGVAGFGAPIAIVAPLLVAYGLKPLYAVAIPIIAHIWAKMFGTLAVGWLATIQVVDLANETMAAFQAALFLIIPAVLGGFTVVWMYGRWAAIKHGWPLVLIISAIHGGVQLVMTLVDPVLSAFIASTIALVALYPLSRWKRFSEPAEGIDERPAMREDHATDALADDEGEGQMGMGLAMLPYIVLIVVALGVLMIEPINQALGSITIGMPFPGVETGYGVTNDPTAPYSPFAPLTHPGTFLLITTIVTGLVYRARGYYKATEHEHDEGLGRALLLEAVPASVPIIAFLVMAKLMDHSGQNQVLALGIAATAPAYVYAFLANAIGVVGAFMTSSSTSSNVLFSGLQQTVAELNDLPEATIIGAQSAGGAIGNAIAPANVVLGASTAGIRGQEGEILRKTIPWTIVATIVTGIATVLLVMLQT